MKHAPLLATSITLTFAAATGAAARLPEAGSLLGHAATIPYEKVACDNPNVALRTDDKSTGYYSDGKSVSKYRLEVSADPDRDGFAREHIFTSPCPGR